MHISGNSDAVDAPIVDLKAICPDCDGSYRFPVIEFDNPAARDVVTNKAVTPNMATIETLAPAPVSAPPWPFIAALTGLFFLVN